MDDNLENSNYVIITFVAFIVGSFIVVILLLSGNSNNNECSSDNDCKSGENCVSGDCKLSDGQICTENVQCVSNFCDATCKKKPTENATKIPKKNKTSIILKAPPIRIDPPSPFIRSPPKTINPPRGQFKMPKIVFEEVPPLANDEVPPLANDEIPYTEEGPCGYTLVTPNSEKISEEIFEKNVKVLPYKDVECAIDFSKSVVYLHKDGRLRRDETLIKIKSNIKIKQLASFGGYLIALTEKKLYYLNNGDYTKNYWNFRNIGEILPEDISVLGNIIRIGNTIYNENLIIQTENSLLVLNSGGLIDQIEYSPSSVRIYGTIHNYIDIDLETEIGYVKSDDIKRLDGQKYYDILGAVINYDGSLSVLSTIVARKYGFNKIVLLNWESYYA
jgi:hypothetical protein